MKLTAALRVKNISDQIMPMVSFTERNDEETVLEIKQPQSTKPSSYTFNFCTNSTKTYNQAKLNPGSADALNGLEKEQKKIYGKLRPRIHEHLKSSTNFTLIGIGSKRAGKTYSFFGKKSVSGIFQLMCEDILKLLQDEASSKRELEIAELEHRQKVIDLLESSIVIRNETYNFGDRHMTDLEIKDDALVGAKFDVTEGFSLFISSMEIVQERAYDLLSNVEKKCRASKVHALSGVGYFLEGQTRIKARTVKEVEAILAIISKNKAVLRNISGVYQSETSTYTKIDIFQRHPTEKSKLVSCCFSFLDASRSDMSSESANDRLQDSYLSNKSVHSLRKLFYDLSEKISAKSIEEIKSNQVYQEALKTVSKSRGSLYRQTFVSAVITDDEFDNVRQKLISECTKQNFANIKDDVLSKIDFEGSVITKLLKASFITGSEILLMFHVSLTKKKLALAIDSLNMSKMISEANLEQLNVLRKNESEYIRGLELQKQNLMKEVSRQSKVERLSMLQKAQVLDVARNKESVDMKLKEIDFLLQARQTQKYSESVRLSKVMRFEAENKFFRGLKNIDIDPLLNMKISYPFHTTREVIITRLPNNIAEVNKGTIFKDLDIAVDKILVNNVGVIEDHVMIQIRDSLIFIVAKNPYAASNTFVNGEDLEKSYSLQSQKYERRLVHLDRLIVGTFHTFLVFDPYSQNLKDPDVSEQMIDWNFCQLEKFQKQEVLEHTKIELILKKNELELQHKAKKLHEDFEKGNIELRSKMDAEENNFKLALSKIEQKNKTAAPQSSLNGGQSEVLSNSGAEAAIAEIHEKHNKRYNELSKEKRELSAQFQENLRLLEREIEMNSIYQILNLNLEKKVITCYSKIMEANQIAKYLGRKVEFHPFLETLNVYEAMSANPDNITETILKVKVINNERKWVNVWPMEKFENRLILFREEFDHFQKTHTSKLTGKSDPFYDEKEYLLVAKGVIMLKNVLYRFDVSPKVGLISTDGTIAFINAKVSCVNENGLGVDEKEMQKIVKSPTDLIEKNVCANFKISFEKIVFYNIEKFANKQAYLTLNVKTGLEMTQFKTFNFRIQDNEINLDWNSVVNIPNMTQEVIEYFLNNYVVISLFVSDYNVDDLGITRKLNTDKNIRKQSWLPADQLSGSEVEEEPKQKSKMCELF